MRGATVLFAVTCAAAPASAQQLWSPEIGIQGGFARFKPAGTGRDDAITFIDLPGGSFVTAILSYAPLYGIVPIGNRFAVEPQVGATQAAAGGLSFTFVRVGARLDYAVTRGLYVAGGGIVNDIQRGPPHHTQLGLQVGFGYRAHLSGSLTGRIEAGWLTARNSKAFPVPFNAYTVVVGLSSRIDSPPGQRAHTAAPQPTWAPMFGINAGYVSAHAVGSETITLLFFPGSGADPTSLGVLIPTPPTLFLLLPLGGKWAFEPGFDLEHSKAPLPNGSITKVAVGSRIDYAVHGGWYAGFGGQVTYISPVVGSSAAVPGVSGAWGYRFHLVGALGGRFEVGYLMSAKHHNLGIPAINTLNLLFGSTMRLR